ncbi:MAG: hypothetical protein ACP5NP_05540 [Acetobacteraceae bacterium]
MHIEILVEDSSGRCLLDHLLPKLIGPHGAPHTWRLHDYRGIGRIPPGLRGGGNPAHRILLDQLPRILRGYARTPGIDAIVVVLDTDDRDCTTFLAELRGLAEACGTAPRTLFRLAIEEIEAWYLGDRDALAAAFPRARMGPLETYRQDSVCGTWELIADAVHPGGSAAVRRAGWPLPGQLKHDWADRIGPLLDPERNLSPSFGKLCDGLRRLTGLSPAPAPG